MIAGLQVEQQHSGHVVMLQQLISKAREYPPQLKIATVCYFNVNLLSNQTPRLRTTDGGLIVTFPIVIMQSDWASLVNLAHEPNHTSSVLSPLSCSRRGAHQLTTSLTQLWSTTRAASTSLTEML